VASPGVVESLLKSCGRALIFGDKSTTAQYANNPAIQLHGPGYSKILIGADKIERWPQFIDVIAGSIADNGGRSCINASAVVVPKYGAEIAEALAKKLGPITPLPAQEEKAQLSGFANAKMAEYIDASIEEGLKTAGARDATAAYRNGSRKAELDGGTYFDQRLCSATRLRIRSRIANSSALTQALLKCRSPKC